MKKEYIFTGIGVIIIVWLIWRFSQELDKKISLKDENNALKQDRLILMKEYLKISKEIPSEIKTQIEKLITEYKDIDLKVAKELLDVLNLIEQKMEPKAIATLAKIIENLLKDKYAVKMLEGKYSNQEEFVTKKKKITFFKVVEFAKSENFLSEQEYDLANLLRNFRNKSSHELDVKIEKNLTIIALLTGIEIVLKLQGKRAA